MRQRFACSRFDVFKQPKYVNECIEFKPQHQHVPRLNSVFVLDCYIVLYIYTSNHIWIYLMLVYDISFWFVTSCITSYIHNLFQVHLTHSSGWIHWQPALPGGVSVATEAAVQVLWRPRLALDFSPTLLCPCCAWCPTWRHSVLFRTWNKNIRTWLFWLGGFQLVWGYKHVAWIRTFRRCGGNPHSEASPDEVNLKVHETSVDGTVNVISLLNLLPGTCLRTYMHEIQWDPNMAYWYMYQHFAVCMFATSK